MATARTRANAKYRAKANDLFTLLLFKGDKEIMKNYAEAEGKSLNKFIKDCINEHTKNDDIL